MLLWEAGIEANEWGRRSAHRARWDSGGGVAPGKGSRGRARGGACGIPATWTRKEAESSPARRPFPGGPLLRLPPAGAPKSQSRSAVPRVPLQVATDFRRRPLLAADRCPVLGRPVRDRDPGEVGAGGGPARGTRPRGGQRGWTGRAAGRSWRGGSRSPKPARGRQERGARRRRLRAQVKGRAGRSRGRARLELSRGPGA